MNSNRTVVAVVLLGLLAVGCGSDADVVTTPPLTEQPTSSTRVIAPEAPATTAAPESTTTSTSTPPTQPPPPTTTIAFPPWPKHFDDGSIDIASGQSGVAGDPTEIALSFLVIDIGDALVETSLVDPQHATVVVTTDTSLLDDSVATSIETITLVQSDGLWTVEAAEWAVICQPDRGHQEPSSATCF